MAKSNKFARSLLHENDAVGGEIKSIALGGIMIVLALVIALTVLPILTSAVADAQGDANVTSSQSTLLGLIPTVVIVALVVGGVSFMFQGIRNLRT